MKKEYPGIRSRVQGGVIYTLILAVMVAAGFFTIYIPLAFFFIVSILMAGEGLNALAKKLVDVSWAPAIFGVILIIIPAFSLLDSQRAWFAKAGIGATTSLLLLGVFSLIVVLSHLIRVGPDGLPGAVTEAGTTLYIFGAFSVLAPLLLFVPRGLVWLIFALLSPAASDVFAYFGGVRFGKKKIVPKLSPSKTWGGTLFGLVGSVLLSVIFFLFWLRPASASFIQVALLMLVSGVLLSLVSQAGDWFASSIKRFIGIKDFSTLIPGHGGLLDRLDSFLPVLPTVFLISVLVEMVFA